MSVAVSKSVLIATANSIHSQTIRSVVERAGYLAAFASSADEALDVLNDRLSSIRLVIVDMNLRGDDGLDIVRVVRYLDPEHQIRSIVRCEQPDEHDKIACIAAGADACIPLRIDAKALMSAIWKLPRDPYEDETRSALAV